MGVAKASVADIGDGKYIGTTTVGERQGALVAEEIHIFPEGYARTGKATTTGPAAEQQNDQRQRRRHLEHGQGPRHD